MYSKIHFKYIVIIFLLGLPGFQYMAFGQKELPADFCITEKESELYDIVNEYRKAMNLPAIPLSKSLCFVAKTHLQDLIRNKPDSSTCNFHSWSDKGDWTPCCYQKENIDHKCMQLKPQELTNYQGKAYEIVYWESKDATPDRAFNQWRETIASRSVLISRGDWEGFSWNAIGIGIMGNFAVIWLGEDFDVEKETKVCGKNKVITNNPPATPEEPQIVASATNRFYLIFGSFNSIKDAKSQAMKYISEGFKKTKIISKDNKFRISLSDYSSKELASKGKKELPAKYKDAWIMPY